MSVLRVIAFDPGGTTGWSVIGVPYESVFGDEKGSVAEFDCGEFNGTENDQVIAMCRLARDMDDPDASPATPALVTEDFNLHTQSMAKEALSPVRINAALEFAVEHGFATFSNLFYQAPSLAKSTATDERLRIWDLYDASSRHARDATRHAITFIRRVSSDEKLRSQAWKLSRE
jgi:hypothetical protein